jgi:hypothetical protein
MTRLTNRFANEGWIAEQPSGTVNGSNVTFTLTYAVDPPPQGAQVMLDGINLYYTTDFTISGNTITMTFAPAAGQTLWAIYQRAL